MQPPPPDVWTLAGPWINELVLRSIWGLIIFAQYGGRVDSLSITSWWRDPVTNLDAGGDSRSGHLLGLGIDWYPALAGLEAAFSAAGLYPSISARGNVHVQLTPPPTLERLGLLAAAMQIGAVREA